MKLFVPPLKTELKLTSAWTFKLHPEERNRGLFDLLGIRFIDPWEWRDIQEAKTGVRQWDYAPPTEVKLPKGTILIVDRIYIRQQAEDFDSITFRIKEMPGQKKKARFWAKLEDCNRMNIQVVG